MIGWRDTITPDPAQRISNAHGRLTGLGLGDEAMAMMWLAAFQDVASRAACCAQVNLASANYFMGRGWLGPLARESTQSAPSSNTIKTQARSNGIVIPAAQVLNPGKEIRLADVWIRDGIIEALMPTGSIAPEGYSLLEDCRGHWVIPGLIDMHVHLPSDNVLKLTPHFMRMFVAHGVTGLRETGDVDGTAIPAALDWKLKNPQLGPTIAFSKYFVGRPPFRWKNSLAYECEADAKEIVAQLKSEGATCIKLYENLREHDIRVLKETAEDAGLVVLGHVPTRLRYEQANLSDTQHFFGVPDPTSLRRDHVFSRTADWDTVDSHRLDEVVAHTVRHGLANTPTLTINKALMGYENPELLASSTAGRMPSFFSEVIWHPAKGLPVYRGLQTEDFERLHRAFEIKKNLFKQLYQAGCTLFAGTDTMQPFSIPGYTLHQELKNFVEAGMRPIDALKAATIDSAQRLGWFDKGQIIEGYRADVVVLRDNPAVNINALDTIHTVIIDGIPVRKVDIDREIKADLDSREMTFRKLSSRILATLAMRRAARNFTA